MPMPPIPSMNRLVAIGRLMNAAETYMPCFNSLKHDPGRQAGQASTCRDEPDARIFFETRLDTRQENRNNAPELADVSPRVDQLEQRTWLRGCRRNAWSRNIEWRAASSAITRRLAALSVRRVAAHRPTGATEPLSRRETMAATHVRLNHRRGEPVSGTEL